MRVSYATGLLFYFRGDEEIWKFFAKNYGVNKNDLPAICERPSPNIWSLEKTGNVELYVNLLELVDHSTGNPWLDTINCQGGGWYGWDEDTIVHLNKSYKGARAILEQTSLVDDLIELDAKAVLLDLIIPWNKGRLPEWESKEIYQPKMLSV